MGTAWNPSTCPPVVALTNNNLTATSSVGYGWSGVYATTSKTSGKKYFEVYVNSGNPCIGIVQNGFPITENVGYYNYTNYRGYEGFTGKKGPEDSAYGSSFAAGITIGVAVNLDDNTLRFYRQNVSQGDSHTNLSLIKPVFPAIIGRSTTEIQITANFGATAFTYTPPAGYSAWDAAASVSKHQAMTGGT